MSIVHETFEGGSNGIPVTQSNTNFGAVTSGIVFDNTVKAHGSLSAKFDATTGTGRYCRHNITGTSVSVSQYMNLAGLTAADERLLVVTDAGGTTVAYVVANGAGKLRLGHTGTTAAWTATNVYPTNTWLRVDLYVVAGSTTTNGTLKLGIYLGDSTSPIESVFLATNVNIGGGGATLGQIRYGKTSSSLAANVWVDDVRYDSAATDLIGPIANVPPTVTLTGNQSVSGGATATVAVTASDPDGSIASYAAVVDTAKSTSSPTLSGASTASVSFTAPAAPALVTLTETVTDNSGATAVATTEVRVPVSGATDVKPMNVTPVTSGTWSVVNAANAAAALGDSSDASYIESGTVSGTVQTFRQRLEPSQTRSTGQVTLRLSSDVGTVNWTIKVYEGATLRETFTQATGSTPNDYTFTLASGTVTAITDWGNVWVEYGVTS